jgi:hypothetical protein
MNGLRASGAAAALLIALGASGCSTPLNEQLVGTYMVMPACQSFAVLNYSLYAQGYVIFSTNNYDNKIEYFSDSGCTMPSATYEQQGGYVLGQPSAVISGATEIEFDVTLRLLTPQTDASAMLFNSLMYCGGTTAGGWVNGIRRDITATGCSDRATNPDLFANCKAEYNILQLTGDSLSVGKADSVGSNCTPQGRPITLGTMLQRQSM